MPILKRVLILSPCRIISSVRLKNGPALVIEADLSESYLFLLQKLILHPFTYQKK